MKKRLILALVTITLLSLLLACSQAPSPSPAPKPPTSTAPSPASTSTASSKTTQAPSPSPKASPSAAPAKVYELKASLLFASEEIRGTMMTKFSDDVLKRSGGQIKIQNYWAESLVKANEALPALQNDTIQIAVLVATYFTKAMPLASAMSIIPFGFPLDKAPQAIRNPGGFNDQATASFTKENMVPLIWIPTTGQQLWLKKAAKNVDELKGRRIRVGGELQVRMFKLMGIDAITMPLSDVFAAAQSGMIDGTVFNVEYAMSHGIPDVLKFLGYIPQGTYLAIYPLVINQKTMSSLPPNLQQALKDSALAAESDYLKELVSSHAKDVAKLESTPNFTVFRYPADEINRMRDMIQPYFDDQEASLKSSPNDLATYKTFRQWSRVQ